MEDIDTINSRLSAERNSLLDEKKALTAHVADLKSELSRLHNEIDLWRKRAAEVVDMLHAFSPTMARFVTRAWTSGVMS